MNQLQRILIGAFLVVTGTLCVMHEDSPLYYGEYSGSFVIRWAFQDICDHVYDMRHIFPTWKDACPIFDPKAVKPGDLVFVREITKFMSDIHPKIESPYIIVTAGEYRDKVEPEYRSFLDEDTIIAWFCVHPCCKNFHPKFHAIPLGIQQNELRYDEYERFNEKFTQLRHTPKKGLLYMNFRRDDKNGGQAYSDTRRAVYDLFFDKAYCYVTGRKGFDSYMKEMSSYKFTPSPVGVGPDCYRTWEALLVGTIPIVQRGSTDELYADLPVLLIDDWQEVTADFLDSVWQEYTSKRFDIKRLFVEFWSQKIISVQKDFFANTSRL